MRFWWVNHKQTFDHEFRGRYIWCPKRKQNGTLNHFYETLREVQTGDLVFSYAYGHLQGVGAALQPCYSCPRPDEFGKVGELWDILGWRVDVDFQRFSRPLRVAAIAAQLAPLLPERYSPIRSTGHGNQGAYLAEVPRAMAALLIEHADPFLLRLLDPPMMVAEDARTIADPEPLIDWEDALQRRIDTSASLPETTRRALILARRGQGLFKRNVAGFEVACRVTHVHNPTHLIASHIKPWRECDNEERLAGVNGLLLTPSIDHLFDRGFITFGDDGEVLVSPVADPDSLPRMGVRLDRPLLTGPFNADQRHFLDYHRKSIFLKSAI